MVVVGGRTELFYRGITTGGKVKTVKVTLDRKVQATNQYLHKFNRTAIAQSVKQFGLTHLEIYPVSEEFLKTLQID